MLLFAVCVSLIAVTSAADPTPCSAPAQWEGLLGEEIGGEHEGKAYLINEGALMSVSAPNKMMNFVGQVNSSDGSKTMFRVLMDYKGKQQYTIVHKKCTKAKIAEPFINGVPPNATYCGTYYFGAGKGNELLFNEWNIKYKGMKYEAQIATTVKDCIPVSYFAFGVVNKDLVMVTAGFVNITLGIKDNSVFTVPDICKKATYPHPILAGLEGKFQMHL